MIHDIKNSFFYKLFTAIIDFPSGKVQPQFSLATHSPFPSKRKPGLQ